MKNNRAYNDALLFFQEKFVWNVIVN